MRDNDARNLLAVLVAIEGRIKLCFRLRDITSLPLLTEAIHATFNSISQIDLCCDFTEHSTMRTEPTKLPNGKDNFQISTNFRDRGNHFLSRFSLCFLRILYCKAYFDFARKLKFAFYHASLPSGVSAFSSCYTYAMYML